MYYDDDIDIGKTQEKRAKIYRNGDPLTKPVSVKLSKMTKFHDIRQQIEESLNMGRIKQLRLFTQEGVEILEDDIEYMKDGIILYASKGEDFDANSTFSEYELVKEIGEGGFGKVLLGIHKTTKEKVAIKILKTNLIGNAQDIDMVFREAEILKSLQHNNIVQIKNCYTLSDMQVVFIMEYLEGGELLDRVEQKGKFQEDEAKIYFKQIVEAMAYCHKNKLIHRDLKLENLLVSKPDKNEIKVVDFGIAGVACNINIDNMDAGSLRYMAPEVLQQKIKQLTPAIDVWAMGVILYGMLVGDLPFKGNGNKEMIQKIVNGEFELPPEIDKKISAECKDVLHKCLEVDPQYRISTVDLLNHHWINDNKFNLIEEKKNEAIEEPSKPAKELQKLSKTTQLSNDSQQKGKQSIGGPQLKHAKQASFSHLSPPTMASSTKKLLNEKAGSLNKKSFATSNVAKKK